MRTLLRLLAVVMLACAAWAPASIAHAAEQPRVLVITDGNEDAVVADYALVRLGMEARRWQFDLVEGEPDDLSDLDGVDVVMLLNTAGDVLDTAQQDALQAFVEDGGGLLGTHSAALAEPDWDWWNEINGGPAEPLPGDQSSQRTVDFTQDSPVTEGLDEDLELKERWYQLDPGPVDAGAVIAATTNEDLPAVWTAPQDKVFYSMPGGDYETWGERDFLQLIRQAIWWAAGEQGEMVQYTGDAAPAWPYTWTFILFVVAVAGGGSIAVWRLDRTELAPADKEAGPAPA